jgi:cyclopropane fatty-acyl-phospholipid synthase-like methyltransferase
VDFVFSYGTFVHIDPEGIHAYLMEIARVLKPGGKVVIQYANKEKPVAQQNAGFSDMIPAKMETIVSTIPALAWVEHNTAITEHSSIAVLKKS